jgi:hypothetical protein
LRREARTLTGVQAIMNIRWHQRHVMPKNATLEQRIAWHREHQKHCSCRPMPPKLRAQMPPASSSPTKLKTRQAKEKRNDQAARCDPRFAPVVDAFANERHVTYGGKGFGSSGLKVHGKLFAMISSKGKFVAKLPRDRVDELVRLGKGEYFDPGHGRLMKEWIALDGATSSWVELAREAHRFVMGQPTKTGPPRK